LLFFTKKINDQFFYQYKNRLKFLSYILPPIKTKIPSFHLSFSFTIYQFLKIKTSPSIYPNHSQARLTSYSPPE